MQTVSENLQKNILAADAVGFSKLVSENEYETLASLKDCLNIFAELISINGGRIFHSAGDSVLAEFVDSKNALKAASQFKVRYASIRKAQSYRNSSSELASILEKYLRMEKICLVKQLTLL